MSILDCVLLSGNKPAIIKSVVFDLKPSLNINGDFNCFPSANVKF